MTSDRSEDRRVQIQAMLKAEPCDSDPRVCRESWPDDPQSWCAGCLCYAADVELDRLSRERDEARAEEEKFRTAARVLCGAHIGVPQPHCPVCRAVAAESQLSALSRLAQELRHAAFDYFLHSELHMHVIGVDKSVRLLAARDAVDAALSPTPEGQPALRPPDHRAPEISAYTPQGAFQPCHADVLLELANGDRT